ncbi:helix-turn-helix transcriptional regulator [Streptococcus uberis]|uniref:helix-turn-helix domain-containing protein n=1 Tax=Streptococcus uberis TaxID=1349 RepID=UPI00389177B1
MNRLKDLREFHNETLRDLSQKLLEIYDYKVSAGQLSNYENENRTPRDSRVWELIAEYFEVDVAYLLGYSDEPIKTKGDYERWKTYDIADDELKLVFPFIKKDQKEYLFLELCKIGIYLSDEQFQSIFNLLESLSSSNNSYLTGLARIHKSEKILQFELDNKFKMLDNNIPFWKNEVSKLKANQSSNN